MAKATARTLVDEFVDRGVVRIPAAFGRAQAGAIVDAIWRHVDRTTPLRRHDRATWDARPISFKRLKRHSALDALTDNRPVRSALDGIFGAGEWAASKSGPQILMTMPNATTWRLPHTLWHTDSGLELHTFPTFGVKLFAPVDTVRPGGGATLAIAGSHRLVRPFATEQPPGKDMSRSWKAFMRQDPWLARVADPRRESDAGLLDGPHRIGDVEVEIVEMLGDPGDVWVTHLHTFHCAAPNARDTPRMMIAQPVMRVPRQG